MAEPAALSAFSAGIAGPATDAPDAAVEEAVRDYARLVYRVAYSVLRNHHAAEDATQETFLRVLKLRRRMEGVVSRKTWLAKIAFHVALDRRPRARVLSLDDPSVAQAARSVPSGDSGAEELASDSQMRNLLERLVAELPSDLRETLQLSTVDELRSGEVAEVLGIPEGTVRTRLLRARRLLRQQVAEMGGGVRG